MSKGQRGKRGGGHSDLYVCVCVYFSLAYSVFQFTIVVSLPLFESISHPVGLRNVRNFSAAFHMGKIAGVRICLLQMAECSI